MVHRMQKGLRKRLTCDNNAFFIVDTRGLPTVVCMHWPPHIRHTLVSLDYSLAHFGQSRLLSRTLRSASIPVLHTSVSLVLLSRTPRSASITLWHTSFSLDPCLAHFGHPRSCLAHSGKPRSSLAHFGQPRSLSRTLRSTSIAVFHTNFVSPCPAHHKSTLIRPHPSWRGVSFVRDVTRY